MTDSDFLTWVANRLVRVYGDDENMDFVLRLRSMASAARGGERELAIKLCALNVERYHGRRIPDHPHRGRNEIVSDEAVGPPHNALRHERTQRDERGYCDFHGEMAVRFTEHGIGAARGGAPAPDPHELAEETKRVAQSAALVMFKTMVAAYRDALQEGCDSAGAYDCMVQAADELIETDGVRGAPAVPSEAAIQKVSAAERLWEVLEKIAAYGLPDDAIAPERDDFSTPEDRTIHAWVRQAREALAEGSLAPAPSGPWKVSAPNEYLGAHNPFAADAKWIVRSDSRPGESAIVATEAEAIAVRDALNRVARLAVPGEGSDDAKPR